MIVEILAQKYKCGCNRGMTAIEYPSLLGKLNAIIEWDYCKFPPKAGGKEDSPEAEDREFLGEDPELKPGNCFLYRGQVIAVDSNEKLVLVVSETGHGALQRIWDEDIKPELEMMFYTAEVSDVKWEATNTIPSEFSETWRVPYYIYKIWKEHFVKGRGFLETGLCIKTVMESENFIYPIELYLMDWSVRYNPSILDEEEVEVAVNDLLSWFYNNYQRIKPIEEPESKEEDEEEGCTCCSMP